MSVCAFGEPPSVIRRTFSRLYHPAPSKSNKYPKMYKQFRQPCYVIIST